MSSDNLDFVGATEKEILLARRRATRQREAHESTYAAYLHALKSGKDAAARVLLAKVNRQKLALELTEQFLREMTAIETAKASKK